MQHPLCKSVNPIRKSTFSQIARNINVFKYIYTRINKFKLKIMVYNIKIYAYLPDLDPRIKMLDPHPCI